MGKEKYINLNRELLYKEYWINNKSLREIGIKYNLKSPKYIFKKLNISKRNSKTATKLAMSKPEMREKMSIINREIMNRPEVKLKHSLIHKKLPPYWKGKKLTFTVWNKGLKGYKSGKNNGNWRGGITIIYDIIRTLDKYYEWRDSVYKRDNYRCQECFKLSDKDLNAHHIKPFSIILQEFLQQYSQFSPIEDKETLIRLAITYAPFWELSNGKTLCKSCHDKLRKETYKIINNLRHKI